jgi:hypothetical protein
MIREMKYLLLPSHSITIFKTITYGTISTLYYIIFLTIKQKVAI